MGHTLVTRFDEEGYQRIRSLLADAGIYGTNKIPYGRDCDREVANALLPYHVTVVHWGKQQDAVYLPRLDDFQFQPCRLKVTGADILEAEEYSRLLYLKIEPEKGWNEMRGALTSAIGTSPQGFLHMTLSVSKDRGLITKQRIAIQKTEPFLLNVVGLDLYHIWKLVRWIRTF